MENISGNKLLANLDRVVGNHIPITADIFLTNYCNNKCPYCTYGRWEFEKGAYSMKYDEFVNYAEKLITLGVKGMILTGGGEPTLCKDFGKITKWLEENDIHYGINTNFNKTVFIRPDYLKVSLDGWDEDSYKKSRGVEAYNKVRKNIIEYACWKAMHSPKTSLGIQRVVTSVEDVEKFYHANKDLPVDYISFRPVESTAGEYYNDEQSMKEAQKIVEAIEKLKERDERVVINFKWNMLHEQEKKCLAQWAQIALNEHGEVMYCCHKPYQIIGHIMDDDIIEKKANANTDMRKCDIPCRMTAPNNFMGQVQRRRKDAFFI